MNEECLICKAPLTYLEADILMECEICHKKENSKTRCVNGHYVCNECHTKGLDRIIALCMTSGDDESRTERSRRRLRLLGCLRCGNQHGDVCVHHFAVYAANQ